MAKKTEKAAKKKATVSKGVKHWLAAAALKEGKVDREKQIDDEVSMLTFVLDVWLVFTI